MNIQQIDKKILELQKKKEELIVKQKTNKLFKFKNLEITQIQDWNKPYNQIIIPSGFRLIKVQELIDLLESDSAGKFLGDYKDKHNWFWCEQTKYDKLNNYSRRLFRGRGGSWDAFWSGLGYSDAGGRVVFVKEKNGK